MTHKKLVGGKMLVGMSVLVATAVASGSSALAAGAGASVRAHMKVPVKSLARTVALSPKEIRRSLRARGYRKINFTDRTLPVYRVRACRNGKRFNLRLNRWGDIKKRVRIGWCDGGYDGPRNTGLSFPEIRQKLRNRGYHAIRFTDRQLPGYRARACRKGRNYVLRLNRWGRVMDRDRRGRCGRPGGYYRGPVLRYDGPGITIRLR